MDENTNLVLISGKAATGKTVSLRNLQKPKGVLYLNCDVGKRLPFKNEFNSKTIVDPMQVYEAFPWLETKPDMHTGIIDTLTFLMDMYESMYVINSANTMKALTNRAA